MANPFYIEPTNPLAALMAGQQGYETANKRFKEQQLQEGRQRISNMLTEGAKPTDVFGQLLGLGDVQGATALGQYLNQDASRKHSEAALAETMRHNKALEGIQTATLSRKETPEKIRILEMSGIDPKSPEGRQALYKLDEKLTPTDRKQIFETEDENAKLTDTLAALNRAKELNTKTFTGITAGVRGYLGTAVPGAGAVLDKGASEATREFGQVMSGEAIKTMAATLKGATTDFELRKFEQMLADPSTPPQIRGRVIERMIALAQRQIEINKTRMDQLRGGQYYKPGGGQSAIPSPDVRVGPPLTPKDQSQIPPPPPGFTLVK